MGIYIIINLFSDGSIAIYDGKNVFNITQNIEGSNFKDNLMNKSPFVINGEKYFEINDDSSIIKKNKFKLYDEIFFKKEDITQNKNNSFHNFEYNLNKTDWERDRKWLIKNSMNYNYLLYMFNEENTDISCLLLKENEEEIYTLPLLNDKKKLKGVYSCKDLIYSFNVNRELNTQDKEKFLINIGNENTFLQKINKLKIFNETIKIEKEKQIDNFFSTKEINIDKIVLKFLIYKNNFYQIVGNSSINKIISEDHFSLYKYDKNIINKVYKSNDPKEQLISKFYSLKEVNEIIQNKQLQWDTHGVSIYEGYSFFNRLKEIEKFLYIKEEEF